MSEELKACPFCGGVSALWFPLDKSRFQAVCIDHRCIVHPRGQEHYSGEAAIAAWNRRVGEG